MILLSLSVSDTPVSCQGHNTNSELIWKYYAIILLWLRYNAIPELTEVHTAVI